MQIFDLSLAAEIQRILPTFKNYFTDMQTELYLGQNVVYATKNFSDVLRG